MSFGAFEQNQTQMIAEINTTPLIDVLLVLLVVFLVTLPLTTMRVPVVLPQVVSEPAPLTKQIQHIVIDAEGKIFWDTQPVSLADLEQRFVALERTPVPLRLHVDAQTTFEIVAKVLASANTHHLTRIEFVTMPPSSR